MNTTEAAKLIGCTSKHVQLLIRSGKLRARKRRSTHNQHGFEYSITEREARKYAANRLPVGRPKGASK